jgi:hypothetical protein
LREALREHDARLAQATLALAEYKHRAHTAELRLDESSSDSVRTAALEKAAKEKELLVSKLRHEGRPAPRPRGTRC